MTVGSSTAHAPSLNNFRSLKRRARWRDETARERGFDAMAFELRLCRDPVVTVKRYPFQVESFGVKRPGGNCHRDVYPRRNRPALMCRINSMNFRSGETNNRSYRSILIFAEKGIHFSVIFLADDNQRLAVNFENRRTAVRYSLTRIFFIRGSSGC